MRALLTSLVATAALLAAANGPASWILHSGLRTEALAGGLAENMVHMAHLRMVDLQRNNSRAVHRRHARYRAIPERKSHRELRVFLLGNSAAEFSLAPHLVERRLAERLPERTPRVYSLVLPGTKVYDDPPLVAAALRKQADLVVVTPNVVSLTRGASGWSQVLRELYAEEAALGPMDRLRRRVAEHWLPYGAADSLREALLAPLRGAMPWADRRVAEQERMRAALEAIAAASATGDLRALVEAYRSNGLHNLLPHSNKVKPLPTGSQVFDSIAGTGAVLRGSGARGVAFFMPVNPAFRGPAPEGPHARHHIDDALLIDVASQAVGAYRRAGLAAYDLRDALPARAFFDLVHCNGEGMEAFSRLVADRLAELVAAAEGHGPE